MRFIWNSAIKDLRRLRREPTTLLIWLGIPTFMALILTLIFGRGDTRPHGKLLITDEDGGLAATVLAGAFTQGPLGSMISVEKVKRDEGRRMIDKGDASALLIIPAGFTTAVIASTPVKLELIRNPAQRILPAIIEETLSIMTDGAFYLQAVAGEQLRRMSVNQAPTDAGVAQTAVEINRLVTRLQKYFEPRLMRPEPKVIKAKRNNRGLFARLFFPALFNRVVSLFGGASPPEFWADGL